MAQIEYEVVYSNSPQDVQRRVNERIQEGWQPTGGIFALYIPPSIEGTAPSSIWAQAMTRPNPFQIEN